MAPKYWADDDQLAWLRSHLTQFTTSQTAKRTHLFWPETLRVWFEKWPEQDESNVPIMKQRIKNWFNNNSKTFAKTPKIKIFKPVVRKRRLQPIEVYSKRYYDLKAAANVKAEIREAKVSKRQLFGVIRKHTQAAFDAESDEVKAAIFAEVEAFRVDVNSDPDEVDTSPAALAAAIESVPTIVENFLEQLARQTGWNFSVFAGGPDPISGGDIEVVGVHIGKNVEKLPFNKAFDLTAQVKQFLQFLHSSFPPEVCASRALTFEATELPGATSETQARPAVPSTSRPANLDPRLWEDDTLSPPTSPIPTSPPPTLPPPTSPPPVSPPPTSPPPTSPPPVSPPPTPTPPPVLRPLPRPVQRRTTALPLPQLALPPPIPPPTPVPPSQEHPPVSPPVVPSPLPGPPMQAPPPPGSLLPPSGPDDNARGMAPLTIRLRRPPPVPVPNTRSRIAASKAAAPSNINKGTLGKRVRKAAAPREVTTLTSTTRPTKKKK